MPSSPEHLSDRCLSMFFFFLHFAQFFSDKLVQFFGEGGGGVGFYPGPVFPGVFYAGETLCYNTGKIYLSKLRELGSSLKKIKITNSKELKKDSTIPLKIGILSCDPKHFKHF